MSTDSDHIAARALRELLVGDESFVAVVAGNRDQAQMAYEEFARLVKVSKLDAQLHRAYREARMDGRRVRITTVDRTVPKTMDEKLIADLRQILGEIDEALRTFQDLIGRATR